MNKNAMGLVFAVVMAVGSAGPAAVAVGTRGQHTDWMRKFETPGGTLAHEISEGGGTENLDLSQPTWCRVSEEIPDLVQAASNC